MVVLESGGKLQRGEYMLSLDLLVPVVRRCLSGAGGDGRLLGERCGAGAVRKAGKVVQGLQA